MSYNPNDLFTISGLVVKDKKTGKQWSKLSSWFKEKGIENLYNSSHLRNELNRVTMEGRDQFGSKVSIGDFAAAQLRPGTAESCDIISAIAHFSPHFSGNVLLQINVEGASAIVFSEASSRLTIK